MADDFTHQILRMVVGRICQPLGWHAMNSNASDVLADVMRQYMLTIAKTTTAYSCLDNRSEPNMVDLSKAFNDLGVDLSELKEFVSQVHSAPLNEKVPLYPLEQNSAHVHTSDQSESIVRKKRRGSVSSRSGSPSEESDEECEIIPSYLPPLPTLKSKGKDDDDTESGIHPTRDSSDTEQMDTSTPTPLTPHDPTRGLPQSRPRLFSSDVSEDSGSRRSSISEHILNRDLRPEVAKEANNVNVFEGAFQKELSNKSETESSKVNQSEEPSVKEGVVAKKSKLPPLRLMSGSSDTVLPSQQPPLSPLVRSPSNVAPIRQGLPILSPLRTSATIKMSPSLIDTPPLPPLKPSPDLLPSSAKDSVTMETDQSAAVEEEKPHLYQVPGSPQLVPLKEFHVSTEKLPVSSNQLSASPLSETSSVSCDSKRGSPDFSRESTPAELPSLGKSPSVFPSSEELPPHEVETIEEVKDETEVTSVVSSRAVGGVELTSRGKEGVVELEAVLSQLSETESSEDEKATNDKTEEVALSKSDFRVSESSASNTPTPQPSHSHTPHTEESLSPVIGDQSFSSLRPVQELVPSEDNLSISGEGSDSDTEPEPSQDCTTSVTKESADFEETGNSLLDSSEVLEPGREVAEQVAGAESSILRSPVFEGEVSTYSEVGDLKEDSTEMISTLSAQVRDDYTEMTKVLEQELSSDDDSEEEEAVFKTEGESQDEASVLSCVLTTNTEKVKGGIKGRKRTVSKEEVLGISKPKVVRRRKKKGRSKARAKPAAVVPPIETPLHTPLVVSIKRNLYEVPSRPSSIPPPSLPSPPAVMSEPLVISINRHLLRHPKYRLPSQTPEDKPKSQKNRSDVLKIRLAMFGNPSSSTPKSLRSEFETMPTSVQATPTGSLKRELELSPSREEFFKRPKSEPQVETLSHSLSFSSSSSSSDNDDSDSPTPPPPRPSHFTHITPTHMITPSLDLPQTPSSEDDSSSSSSSDSESTSESGESSVGGGAGGGSGLKLTISKAVLKHSGKPMAAARGSAGWSPAKAVTQKPQKQATPTSKTKRKPTAKKPVKGPKLLVSKPVVHTFTPPPPPTFIGPSVGSDTICPVCNHKDDGSPMIGCDSCDNWCHWRCVGVYVDPPENENWYCPSCQEKARKKSKKKQKKSKR